LKKRLKKTGLISKRLTKKWLAGLGQSITLQAIPLAIHYQRVNYGKPPMCPLAKNANILSVWSIKILRRLFLLNNQDDNPRFGLFKNNGFI